LPPQGAPVAAAIINNANGKWFLPGAGGAEWIEAYRR
jgi:hypothetical protein